MTEIFKMASGPRSWNTVLLSMSLILCSTSIYNVWGNLWFSPNFAIKQQVVHLMQLQNLILTSIKDSCFFIQAPNPSCVATWNGMKSRKCITSHFSQWIVNGTNWYMYTRCLNKDWHTWDFGIPYNQQNKHICVLSKYQQMFSFTLTAIDGMQNRFCIVFFVWAS